MEMTSQSGLLGGTLPLLHSLLQSCITMDSVGEGSTLVAMLD